MIRDSALVVWAFCVLFISIYLSALYATGGTLAGAWIQ